MNIRSLILLSVLPVLLAGCTSKNATVDPNSANSATSSGTSDAAVNSDVKIKLASYQDGGMDSVMPNTRDGVVTLTGPVDTQASRERAVMMTRQVRGVSSVQDQMKIGGPGCCGHRGPGMMQEGKGMGEGMNHKPQ